MDTILSQFDWSEAVGWVLVRLALIGLLLALCCVLLNAARRIVPGLIKAAVMKSGQDIDSDELAKRYETLSEVTVKTLEVIIFGNNRCMRRDTLGREIQMS